MAYPYSRLSNDWLEKFVFCVLKNHIEARKEDLNGLVRRMQLFLLRNLGNMLGEMDRLLPPS